MTLFSRGRTFAKARLKPKAWFAPPALGVERGVIGVVVKPGNTSTSTSKHSTVRLLVSTVLYCSVL